MSRQEFPSKVRDQAYARSRGFCENRACGLPLTVGKFAYDHILPDALGGKPELANCMVVCVACHGAKTAKEDVPRIRKADRQRKKFIGAKVAKAQIKSPGFPRTKEPRAPKASLPPIQLYRSV